MVKQVQKTWPEIVFGSSDVTEAKRISRAVANNQLRKIAAKLYTSNFDETPENIVMSHWLGILSHLFPGAIVSHKSAFDGRPKDGEIILTYTNQRTIHLPGLTVRLFKGPKALESDMPFSQLYLSSPERAFLENLQPSRIHKQSSKNISMEEIESKLDKLAQSHGAEYLNELRDRVQIIASSLGFNKEFKKLNQVISSLSGSHDINYLRTNSGIARALQQPYDIKRFELFLSLASFLREGLYKPIPVNYVNDQTYRVLSFWEAYFSNYIEGTTFQVEEAEEIIFHGKLVHDRPAEAHDIKGTYEVVSNIKEMKIIPENSIELIGILKRRHELIMGGRPEKHPGNFKEKLNQAGNTIFVSPELVQGTLIQGFHILQSLPKGFARACFMMFLISEVHPFSDGNGRIARIMMNAELVANNESKIIIPTVYRIDYLGVLKKLTNNGESKPYVDMLYRAQRFTHSIHYQNLADSLEQLRLYNCFGEGDGEVLNFNG
ncbi:MAG: Fic family protein [Leptospirales bacterium]